MKDIFGKYNMVTFVAALGALAINGEILRPDSNLGDWIMAVFCLLGLLFFAYLTKNFFEEADKPKG